MIFQKYIYRIAPSSPQYNFGTFSSPREEKTSHPLSVVSFLSPPKWFSVSVDFPSLDISYQWNHAICGLLCLASFTEHCVLEVYLCWSMSQYFVLFDCQIEFPGLIAFSYSVCVCVCLCRDNRSWGHVGWVGVACCTLSYFSVCPFLRRRWPVCRGSELGRGREGSWWLFPSFPRLWHISSVNNRGSQLLNCRTSSPRGEFVLCLTRLISKAQSPCSHQD